MQFEAQAGINITGTKLQFVELAFNKKEFVFSNVDEAYFESPLDFIHEKDARINSVLHAALHEIILRTPLRTKTVSIALPQELFFNAQLPFDSTVMPLDQNEEFRWELSVLFPGQQAAEWVVQTHDIERGVLTADDCAIVNALPRRWLNICNGLASQAGLELKFVDSAHFASDRAAAMNYDRFKDGIGFSAYYTGRVLSVELLLNGSPFHFASYRLQSAQQLMERIHAFTESFPQHKIRVDQINAAYLCGEELTPSLFKTIETQAGIKFQPVNPFLKLKALSKLVSNKLFREKYAVFSAAAGMAFRAG